MRVMWSGCRNTADGDRRSSDSSTTSTPRSCRVRVGTATTVMVTMTLEQLQTGLGAAQLTTPLTADGTSEISAAQARRLACTAGIIPAVLGGRSEVLDLGRTQRLHPPAIRRALRINHKTCTAEGCSIPAAWCDAHHLTPWARGGETNLKDATLLCGFHHHRIHDPAYEHHLLPAGSIRFHRRT